VILKTPVAIKTRPCRHLAHPSGRHWTSGKRTHWPACSNALCQNANRAGCNHGVMPLIAPCLGTAVAAAAGGNGGCCRAVPVAACGASLDRLGRGTSSHDRQHRTRARRLHPGQPGRLKSGTVPNPDARAAVQRRGDELPVLQSSSAHDSTHWSRACAYRAKMPSVEAEKPFDPTSIYLS
jgi:hypothetical protein